MNNLKAIPFLVITAGLIVTLCVVLSVETTNKNFDIGDVAIIILNIASIIFFGYTTYNIAHEDCGSIDV